MTTSNSEDVLAALDLDHKQFADRGESSLFGDAAREIRDLRSRLACIAEATSWDRPYDTRIDAIRGMCDLTTNGMTPASEIWECGPHTNAWNGHDARCRRVAASPGGPG